MHPATKARLARHLKAGESIVWVGGTDWRVRFAAWLASWFTVVGSIGISYWIVVSLLLDLQQDVRLVWPIVAGFAALEVLMMALSWRVQRRSCCMVTNCRVFIFAGSKEDVYLLEDVMDSVSVHRLFGNVGCVFWDTTGIRRFFFPRTGLFAIADAQHVFDLMCRPVFPFLASRLKSADGETRRKTLRTMIQLSRTCKKAVPLVVDALDSEDSHIRLLAARALGALGPRARAWAPAVRKTAWLDEDERVARAAHDSLRQLTA